MPTIITRGAGSASGYGFANSVTATFSITAGIGYDVDNNQGTGYNYGDAYYYAAFGSCTPAYPSPFAGAKFRAAYIQKLPPYTTTSDFVVNIDGFASDPGQSWFKAVIFNGVTFLTSTAFAYGYDFDGGGTGNTIWAWNTGMPTITSGSTYTVKLIK